jgi:hypothetical protein
MDWLYLCSGLAVLVLSENERSDNGRQTLSWQLGVCVRDGLEIFGQSALLLFIYSFLLSHSLLIAWQKEMVMFFFLIIPYGISRLLRRKGSLFLAVFIFCCWSVFLQTQAKVLATISSLFVLTAFFVLFEILLTGIRRRLLFSKVPQAAEGLPVLLASAAVLTWAIGGLGRFLF